MVSKSSLTLQWTTKTCLTTWTIFLRGFKVEVWWTSWLKDIEIIFTDEINASCIVYCTECALDFHSPRQCVFFCYCVDEQFVKQCFKYHKKCLACRDHSCQYFSTDIVGSVHNKLFIGPTQYTPSCNTVCSECVDISETVRLVSQPAKICGDNICFLDSHPDQIYLVKCLSSTTRDTFGECNEWPLNL